MSNEKLLERYRSRIQFAIELSDDLGQTHYTWWEKFGLIAWVGTRRRQDQEFDRFLWIRIDVVVYDLRRDDIPIVRMFLAMGCPPKTAIKRSLMRQHL